MNDYERMLNEEFTRKTYELYGRIGAMLKVCRKYLSHSIMMELIEVAYPSAGKEVERNDNE